MRFCLTLFLAFLLATTAVSVDVVGTQTQQFGLNGLTDGIEAETQEILGDVSPLDGSDFGGNIINILKNTGKQSISAIQNALITAVSMMAVILLCSMVTQMETKFSHQSVVLAGVLALTLLSVSSVGSMITLGQETLTELQAFTGLLLPVLATATAASGGVSTATALYVGSVFVSNVLMELMNALLVPLTYGFLAVSAADALLGNHTLSSIKKLLKWCIVRGLKLLLYGFTAYLSLSGIISGVGDATAIKAAKLAMSAVVPVVGGMISDASETVLVSATMIRNGAGIFGMLVVISICVLPFARMGIQFLVLRITSAVSATIGDKHLTGLMDAIADAMGFLAGMTGACGFMMLISCVCSMKAVSV